METIVILGAGGFARELAFLIGEINREKPIYNLLGFVVNNPDLVSKTVGEYNIIGDEEWLVDQHVNVALGTGNPQLNSELIHRFGKKDNLEFPNLVHPRTVWHKDRIKFGRGNIVCAGNIFTTDIEIGSFNIFNIKSTFGHDIKIQDGSIFNPGVNISGGVTIGCRCLIGVGAIVLQYLNIGDDVTIGGGAVVTENCIEQGTYVGVPARKMK